MSFFPCTADAGRTDDAVIGFAGVAVVAVVAAGAAVVAAAGVPVRIDCRFRRYSG